MMKIYQKYQTKNNCYKAATPMKPVNILVHSTGADNANLKRYVDYVEICGENKYNNHWNVPNFKKMPHGFLGKDKNGEIAFVQTLPYDYACWGCGKGSKGSYNYNPTGYIQFEICEQKGDKKYFDEVFNAAAEYCAQMCREFGFDPNGIVSHAEAAKKGYASNHGDPDHWLKQYGKNMDWFRSLVKEKMKPEKPKERPVLKFSIGDIVNFVGDKHYISSNSGNAQNCKGGKATITAISEKGVHRYHLVRASDSPSTVYGWVDEEFVNEIVKKPSATRKRAKNRIDVKF